MDNIVDVNNNVQSPIVEKVGTKYKLNLKYGGLFRSARNSCRKVYCFGKRKCIHIEICSYQLNHLLEEVVKHYPIQSDVVLSLLFVNKCEKKQTFIQLDSDEKFMVMLNMYEEEKEVTIYVTTYNCVLESSQDEVTNEPQGENGSDSDCPSENSYHNRHSSDDECDNEPESHSYIKSSSTMELHKTFTNVIQFRRALNHYALVKKFIKTHSCTRTNKCGNKRATQGWIANVIADKLKYDGDISTTEIRKWLMTTYNVDVPYLRAFRGKEQAYTDIHACSRGFLAGCRPYISLDACHLKGKFNEAIAIENKEVIAYLNKHHNKTWSRSKFGTISKCDYITNNISESFNSWVGDARLRPVLDLLDAIREMLMNLGDYQVSRSSDNRAEVKYKGRRWEVLLDEKTCSCRAWQVKGLPCVHAAAFIAFTRDNIWDSYVDSYFTIDKFKEAYASEIAPIPGKDQWVHIDASEKIHPPIVKRPIGRPRKNSRT
ncbi:transposase, MuDR, MULE transposase domain protein [Artemisia annua]|uniref:Transposase, MuDR, MULE transposase domain protein n=1 Tax=Artemisia annua TaxID=35608 RepID=A0A2U1KHU4_ARTAN|nr:transposase, MuDR, MULE transposase domain protein [Artemisia annua]